jgi:peptide/nickel transport system permease protein
MGRSGERRDELTGRPLTETSTAGGTPGNWLEERKFTVQEWRRFLYNFRRSTLSLVGLAVMVSLLVLAAGGAYLAPYPKDATGATHLVDRLQRPSLDHPFGTDELGRDVFSRVILGTGLALQAGVIVLVVAVCIGVLVGAVSGFLGGFLDDIVMRITDVFMTLPYLVLAIAVAVALGSGLRNAILALTVVWWASYCRLMRGEVLRVREELYVLAAQAMGASRPWIILRHLVPNCLTPILVRATMDMGTVILAAASLGFIGVGAQPPQPDWGQMISEGRRVFPTYWWVATFPGLAIFVAVLGFNLFGDGLRDVLEPSSRR